MGKKARIKREAAARRQEKAAEREQEALSRRKFLKRVGAGLAGLAGVSGLGYWAYREEENEKIDAAVKVYHHLEDKVDEKLKEAEAARQPLKIFVLESHESANALAYELMLMDIISRRGIKTLILEQPDQVVKDNLEILNSGAQVTADSPPRVLALYNAARGHGMQIVAMDNAYPTAQALADANARFITEFMGRALEEQYPQIHISLRVHIDPSDVFLDRAHYDVNSSGPLDKAVIDRLFRQGKTEAREISSKERERVMREVLKKQGSALVITGKSHGMGLLAPQGGISGRNLAFSAVDVESYHQYLASPNMDELQKKRFDWADDPANVVPYQGPEFDPKDLTGFIQRVMEKAHNREGVSR